MRLCMSFSLVIESMATRSIPPDRIEVWIAALESDPHEQYFYAF